MLVNLLLWWGNLKGLCFVMLNVLSMLMVELIVN